MHYMKFKECSLSSFLILVYKNINSYILANRENSWKSIAWDFRLETREKQDENQEDDHLTLVSEF